MGHGHGLTTSATSAVWPCSHARDGRPRLAAHSCKEATRDQGLPGEELLLQELGTKAASHFVLLLLPRPRLLRLLPGHLAVGDTLGTSAGLRGAQNTNAEHRGSLCMWSQCKPRWLCWLTASSPENASQAPWHACSESAWMIATRLALAGQNRAGGVAGRGG